MARAAAYEELRDDEIARLTVHLAMRRLLMAPLGLFVMGLFIFYEHSWWRRGGLLLIGITSGIAGFILVRTARRRGLTPGFHRGYAFLTLATIAAVALTGGVDSPGLPALFFAATFLPLIGPPRAAILANLFGAACVLALTVLQATGRFAAVPDVLGGGPHAGSKAMVWTRGLFMTFSLLAWAWVMLRLRRAYDAVGARLVQARDEARADHAEQMRSLTTLAGEIAHELKNPLASVKGLAGLLARDAEGKSAERLGVLRREVDRMHTILEEFLNFSRPLVPLALSEVELVELARDVLRLHESQAAEARVRLALDGPPRAHLRCDRRKVRQILINLVQNAIEASPPGGEVTVEVAVDGRGARCVVRDRGGGLDPSLAARVFEPGVTTKPAGSGLGLTLSRALARQHGGELTLAAASPGCEARLTLPADPVQVAA